MSVDIQTFNRICPEENIDLCVNTNENVDCDKCNKLKFAIEFLKGRSDET